MQSNWAHSALTWWHDAGVDTIVGESPRNWLAPAPAPAPVEAAPAAPAAPIPETLAEFRAWLLESPDLPFAAPGAPRLGPVGDPGAGPMILVDMPSVGDIAAGHLLSGEAGALFDRMMKAIGLNRETIYLAPLSPVRSPSGAIDSRNGAVLADIARRHIALVKPKAVLLFGDNCAKALLGAGIPATRARWHALETPAGPVRTVATIRPEKLLQQPGMKTLAWDDLQMLKKELES